MISHFPVGRFGTMKERFFLIHNQIGTPSAICFAWDKLCLLDDLDYKQAERINMRKLDAVSTSALLSAAQDAEEGC